MSKPILHPHSSAGGFSLIELAVVMTVAGLVMAGLMVSMGPYLENRKYEDTQQKLERIADELARYAQGRFRLPCPADPNPATEPFGAPRRSGADGSAVDVTCSAGAFAVADYIGIVPFRALGLTEEDARDGFGNLITYEVVPTLTGSQNGTDTHGQCRTYAWISVGNAGKARVCCPRQNTGFTTTAISVLDNVTSGQNLFRGTHSTSGADYAAPTSQYSGTPPPTNQFIAFVLVSHGRNGDRAFIKGVSVGTRRPVTANASSQEQWNGFDTAMRNVVRPVSTVNDTSYFDDVVLWRTNTQLINEFGNDSCGRP